MAPLDMQFKVHRERQSLHRGDVAERWTIYQMLSDGRLQGFRLGGRLCSKPNKPKGSKGEGAANLSSSSQQHPLEANDASTPR